MVGISKVRVFSYVDGARVLPITNTVVASPTPVAPSPVHVVRVRVAVVIAAELGVAFSGSACMGWSFLGV